MAPEAVGSADTPIPFVGRFPGRNHPMLRAWFGYAASQGATTPEGVLAIVGRVVDRKLQWSVSPGTQELCRGVLLALTLHRTEALAYARTLVQPGHETPKEQEQA